MLVLNFALAERKSPLAQYPQVPDAQSTIRHYTCKGLLMSMDLLGCRVSETLHQGNYVPALDSLSSLHDTGNDTIRFLIVSSFPDHVVANVCMHTGSQGHTLLLWRNVDRDSSKPLVCCVPWSGFQSA